MIDLLTYLLNYSWSSHPHVLAIGLDLVVKSTLLILLAIGAAAILGRGRILLRTAMWNACLLGLLVLPATSIGLPRLRLAILPPPATPLAAASLVDPSAPAGTSAASVSLDTNSMALAARMESASIEPVSAPTTVGPKGIDVKRVSPSNGSTPSKVAATSRSVDWLAAGAWIYAAGVLVLSVRLICALAAVRRLRRTGLPVTDTAWVETFTGWTMRLEVPCPVRLLHSPDVSVPVAFGWYSPAVMIPSGMVAAAGRGLRDSVLLHELAHVRRCDYLWQLLLRAAQIVYWPNLLIWLIARPISTAREDASDALCVHHAGDPNEYRLTLLEVARSLVRRPVAALGIAMARTSKIARRLEQIDRGLRVSRCLAGRPTRSTLAIGAILIAGVIGAGELASRDLGNDVSKRSESIARLKQIATAFAEYDNASPSLQALVDKKIIAAEMLISPVAPTATQPSYIFIPQSGERDPRDVVMYENPANYKSQGTIVCYGTGAVMWESMAAFRKSLEGTFQRLRRPLPTAYTQEAVNTALAQTPTTQPGRMRYFVALVVGKDRMTFEGQDATWDQVRETLAAVANLKQTVFTVAVDSTDVPVGRFHDAMSKAHQFVKEFGMEYVSDVGVHHLGSKADPPQRLSADGKTQLPEIREASAYGKPHAATEGSRGRLKSGVEIEVVGMCRLPDSKNWWGPDGQPLAEPPCDPYEQNKEQNDSMSEYQFVVRITLPESKTAPTDSTGQAMLSPDMAAAIDQNPQVLEAKKTLADLREKQTAILQKVGQNHPSAQEVKNQIASAEKLLDETLAQMRKQAIQHQNLNLSAQRVSTTFSLDAGGFYCKPAQRNGQLLPDWWTIRGPYKKDKSTATLKVSATDGPWDTRGKSEGNPTGMSNGKIEVIFSEATELRGFASVSVTDRELDRAYRVIAIDKQNRTHESIGTHSVGTENMRVSQVIFPDLALKDAKEFQFQTRPYEWVIFKDVPLRPGLKSFKAATLETTKLPADTKSSKGK